MACGDLHVTQRYAGVERGHNEPGAEHVRVDGSQARSSTDGPDPAMGGAPIKALPISAAQDRPVVAFADREVNGPRRPGHERDRGRLVALAKDVQRPAAALEAEVLDVAGAGFGYAKAVQPEQDRQRRVVAVAVAVAVEAFRGEAPRASDQLHAAYETALREKSFVAT